MSYPAVLAMPWDELLLALAASQTLDAKAAVDHSVALAAIFGG